MVGWLRAPRRMPCAYARGRATERSLHEVFAVWDDAKLDETLGPLRATLGLVDAVPVRARDVGGALRGDSVACFFSWTRLWPCSRQLS
jgi:hypothetical protein